MTRTHAPRRLAAAAMALLLVGGLAACGASGGSDSADKATTTTAGTAAGGSDTTAADGGGTETTKADDGGSATGSEKDYVDALVSTFDADEQDQVFTTDQVQCLAEKFVSAIGVKRFEDAGLSPADVAADDNVMDGMKLDEATARKMVKGFSACKINLREMFMEQFSAAGLTATQKTCLEGVLTEDAIAESFVQDIVGNTEAKDPLDDASSCLYSDTTD